MFVQDCIDTSLPFIRLTDKVGYAIDLMQEYKMPALAVVNDGVFTGSITENQLLEVDDLSLIESLQEDLIRDSLKEGTHLFDVIKKTSEHASYFMPVVNSEKEYIGITTPQKILNTLALHSSFMSGGGIIVLELETKDYSLTEISRIVESNGAMILHCMVATSVNQHQMQVSLKVNKNDLKDIQLAFERYRYTVLAVLHQSEYEMQLKERYDSLMRYLEV